MRTFLLKRPNGLSGRKIGIYGGLTAALGVAIIVYTFAAGTGISFEAESGSLSGAAKLVANAGASGASAIQFGSGVVAGNPLAALPLIPWAGGPSYYNQFSVASAAGWANNTFFPVAAWYMRANVQSDLTAYKAMGINTDLVVEHNDSLPLIRSNGMFALPGGTVGIGPETVGYNLTDEPDMNYGPGSDPWSGNYGWNTCVPIQDKGGKCGYTFMTAMRNAFPASDGRLMYTNYGKGLFPGWQSDAQFAKFINTYNTVVSDDLYWYTDADLCTAAQGPTMIQGTGPISIYTGLHDLTQAECRRSYNYGVSIDRMRMLDALDGKLQPIYGFVEVGSPFPNGGTITGPQIEGAVMSSIIHGAAGILYFKHNFGGSCISNDGLLDCASAPKSNITKVDGYLKDLAPVLNTQSYQYSFGTGTDTILKWYGGSAYVIAMGDKGSTGAKTFTLPSGLTASSVEVLYESRSLPITAGKFTDSFAAEYSYHIYKITP